MAGHEDRDCIARHLPRVEQPSEVGEDAEAQAVAAPAVEEARVHLGVPQEAAPKLGVPRQPELSSPQWCDEGAARGSINQRWTRALL